MSRLFSILASSLSRDGFITSICAADFEETERRGSEAHRKQRRRNAKNKTNTMMPNEKKRSRASLALSSFSPVSRAPFITSHLDLGLGVVRGEGRAERRADRADAAGADDAAGDARGLLVGGRRSGSGRRRDDADSSAASGGGAARGDGGGAGSAHAAGQRRQGRHGCDESAGTEGGVGGGEGALQFTF